MELKQIEAIGLNVPLKAEELTFQQKAAFFQKNADHISHIAKTPYCDKVKCSSKRANQKMSKMIDSQQQSKTQRREPEGDGDEF